MTSCPSRSRLLVPPGGCIPNCPLQKELLSLSRRLDTTCESLSDCHLGRILILLFRGRNQDLWGPDANVFQPERWFEMDGQVESPVGVYGNLYGHMELQWCGWVPTTHSHSSTFSGGVRSCIGWRVACVDHYLYHSLSLGHLTMAFE